MYYYCKMHAKDVNDLKTIKLHVKNVKSEVKNKKKTKAVVFIKKKIKKIKKNV